MHTRTVVVLIVAFALQGCAARTVSPPIMTPPKYPGFVPPAIPAGLATSPAAAHQMLAWRFLQSGDFSNADQEIGAALHGTPGFYPALATAGWIAMARGDAETAVASFARALERQADYLSALIGRGRALVALERDAEAAASFEAALAVNPELTDLRREIDVLKFRDAERRIAAARQAALANHLDEARQLYQRLIANSPESAFLFRELAAVERQVRDDAAALAHYRSAIELDPSDTGSMVQIGELLESGGDRDGALKSYEAALAIAPTARASERRDALRAAITLAQMPPEYQAIGNAAELTRAQLAALIGVGLGRWLTTIPAVNPGVITDVRGNWAETWILTVARTSVMQAYANHTFQPLAIVHRADLAPIVSRLIARLASPEQARAWQQSDVAFTDLEPGHLAYRAASTAVASGIMVGASNGTFQPSQPVSGDAAIAVVQRLQRLADSATGPLPSGR